jgi:hypothetical protein
MIANIKRYAMRNLQLKKEAKSYNMIIHEFKTPIRVHTPHGEGEAVLLIDYGIDVNSIWLVRLGGGVVKHYDSDDIRVYGNPMKGKGFDIEIPINWKQ